MGQKTNPIGNRLGIIRGWESNWYGSRKDYANKLIEDNKITYLPECPYQQRWYFKDRY